MKEKTIESRGYEYFPFLAKAFGRCNPKWCDQMGVPHSEATQEDIYHVFPVSVDTPDGKTGMMVGLEVKNVREGEGWRLSDAFGRMGFDEKDTPLGAIFEFAENAWKARFGSSLPLRWRNPASLYLMAAVHLDMIDGESLQVPLLLTLLRVASSGSDPEALPFGKTPVFATGELSGKGTFESVDYLAVKANGFIREFGTGLPAILTQHQIDELSEECPEIVERFEVYKANNIADLLQLPPLREKLEHLCGPPHDMEVDQLLRRMELGKMQQKFEDVENLCEWLKPHATKPHYRSMILRQLAEMHSHRGDFSSAKIEMEDARKIQEEFPGHFGITEKIHFIAIQQVRAFDSGSPEEAQEFFTDPKNLLKEASLHEKVRYWGSACQLFRALGRYDDAVDAGHRAVDASLAGAVSETHRDINYLVHAYLARARTQQTTCDRDLAAAREWLEKSRGLYCPVKGTRAYRSHIVFCAHLDAEGRRLQGHPCGLDFAEWHLGTWQHASLFYLLSVARNSNNAMKTRREAIKLLVKESAEFRKEYDGVFLLFEAVYGAYWSYCLQPRPAPTLKPLRDTLADLDKRGASGWQKRLAPFLDAAEEAATVKEAREQIELVCDAVYFH